MRFCALQRTGGAKRGGSAGCCGQYRLVAPYLVESCGPDAKVFFCFSCQQLALKGPDFLYLPLGHSDYVPYFPISLDGKSWKVALHVPCRDGKVLVFVSQQRSRCCVEMGKCLSFFATAKQVLCTDGKVLVFVLPQ